MVIIKKKYQDNHNFLFLVCYFIKKSLEIKKAVYYFIICPNVSLTAMASEIG
jgi:hypothetical protein